MLSMEKITLFSTGLGEESLVPDIPGNDSLPFFRKGENFSEDSLPHLGEGMVASVLPYTMQKDYDRDFRNREYQAAVLENDCLKAVFLPELGGRLWSLYDKKRRRDLVYQNDALCFGNLALRNAWFAGGVEWNLGIKGHSPFTCDRLFTVFEKTADGRDVLKMYEYEAIRGLVYVMRFVLDDDRLCVNITVENPGDRPTYMYWWSNIAVEQRPDTRVIVPTRRSFVTSYRDGGYIISHLEIPFVDGTDVSYPARSEVAKDYFYDIPAESAKWLCTFDGTGGGLLHLSDRRMSGRKMFVWGSRQGGDHWNKWLTYGRDYFEVQAGLAKTQFEHFPIAPGEVLSWNEIYTGMELKENRPDGDYDALAAEIGAMADERLLRVDFDAAEEGEIRFFGSGRGALRCLLDGKPLSGRCRFPEESLTEKERYYADLVRGVRGENYRIAYSGEEAVGALIAARPDKTPLDRYLLGINRLIAGETDLAVRCLEEACGGECTALARIALALIFANVKKDPETAFAHARAAVEAEPAYLPITVAFSEIAIRAGKYRECAEVIRSRPENSASGRLKMYLAKCLTELNDLDGARALLSPDLVVPDVREGEYSLTKYYAQLYAKIIARDENRSDVTEEEAMERYPVPAGLDFRMH